MTPWQQVNSVTIGTQFQIAVAGLPKQGKTHFAFTAPQPLWIFNFNAGLIGVQEKFVRAGVQAQMATYQVPSGPEVDIQAEAQRIWGEWEADFDAALATRQGTIIFDTHYEHNQLQRLKEWGKLSMNSQHYTVINSQYKSIMRKVRESGMNAVYLCPLKEAYVGGQPSGNLEPRQWGELGFEVDANLRVYRGQDGIFHIAFVDCRFNPNVMGLDLYDHAEGKLVNVRNVLWQMFSDTSIDPPITPDLSGLVMAEG